MKKTPRIDNLIKTLAPLMEKRGAKTRLAAHTGQNWPAIWKYLNGSRRPSGEVTLAIEEFIKNENANALP